MIFRRAVLILFIASGCADRADAGGMAAGHGGSEAPRVDGAVGDGAGGVGALDAGSAGAAASSGEAGDSGAAGAAGDASSADTDGSTGDDADPVPEVPAELLDLAAWKLTLPIGEEGSPTEILQPALNGFELEPHFHLNDERDGVVFRAHAGGATTSNSGYPRSELREMSSDGSDMAAWSTDTGAHAMTLSLAITHLPVEKPHVAAAQIHDASDDLVMIRLEDTNLFVEGGGDDLGNLDPSYELGTRFTVRIEAAAGRVRIYYEDLVTPKVDVERSADGCYFKAGAYTQSNPDRGDAPDAYGEVVIYDLAVTHE